MGGESNQIGLGIIVDGDCRAPLRLLLVVVVGREL